MSIKDIEKENLEAHVELCSERYKSLHDKFDAVNDRLDKQDVILSEIRSAVTNNDQNRNKQLLTWGASIITLLLTAVGGLLISNHM
jgi:Mg2+ and Co2+ transporter CorA